MPKIYVSSVVDAPAGRVWSQVRDFNALPSWVPAVTASRIEQNHPADKVGCIRNMTLADGNGIREQLLALSDYEYSCSYNILESAMAVVNYNATLKVTPVTDGDRSFLEWSAEFDCPPDRAQGLVEQIGQGVFQAGFSKLNELMRGP